jgi:hypothetical protein
MDGTQPITITTPDKSAAPQSPGTGPWAQVPAKLIDYFLSNVMKTVWGVFLFVGGMFFLIYFTSIGFMPELDLQASLTLLATSALMGCWVLTLISLGLIGPGWIWKSTTNNNEKLKALWYNGEQWVWWRAFLWVGLPFIGFVAGLILLLWIKIDWWAWSKWVGGTLLIGSLIMPLPVILIWEKWLCNPTGIPKLWAIVGNFYWGFLYSAAVFFPLPYVLLGFLPYAPDLVTFASAPVLLLGAAIVIALFNAILATSPYSAWQSIVVSCSILVYVIMFFNAWPFIPNYVMNIYKFGNLANATLVLNETGCAIVEHHGVKATPSTPSPKTDTNAQPQTCSLSKVSIYSRLGSTYYLEASRNENTSVCFTISAQNVLSWAIDPPKIPAKESSTSTQNPARTTETRSPNKCIQPTH